MQGWPTQDDYRVALQNPDIAFRSAGLRACRAELNRLRVPKARSGAFASVYKLEGAAGVVAVKLFTFPSPDRERRYRAIEAHFRRLDATRARPPCLVACKYDPAGIRVKGTSFPVQTMDWVTGDSLGQWLRDTTVRGDIRAIRHMADAWMEVVTGLAAVKIAHGDLQHDNVMVVNGAPILVDYDGMCVPGLEGAEQLENGKPAYQHAKRSEQRLGFGLDHFSAWVILISLRAVAAEPSLYQRFVVAVDNENILFCEEDLLAPAKSELWPLLLRSPDPEVAEWSEKLRAALGQPFADIPPFAIDPFKGLRALAAAVPPDWEAVAAEAARATTAGRHALPAELGRVVAEAGRRIGARDKVNAALRAGDVRAAAAAYRPDLLDDWADAAEACKGGKRAKEQCDLLDRLAAAAHVMADGRELVALWDKAEQSLQGLKEADAFRVLAATWRSRLRAADRFLTVIKNLGATDQALAEAWAAVTKAGPHPSITEAHRRRAEQSMHRLDLLRRLGRLPTAPTEDADRELVKLCGDPVLAARPEAAQFHSRVRPARDRLAAVDRLAAAIDAANAGGDEQTILDAAASIPADYAPRVAARVQRAKDSLRLHANLVALSRQTPASDRRIAEAWETYREQAADRPAPPALAERCELAVRRRDALAALERIDREETAADRQDARWLREWKAQADLLNGCPDAAPLRARVDLAARRHRAWQALKAALDTSDLSRIRDLAADPTLKGYPPAQRDGGRISDLVRRAARMDQLMERLSAPGPVTLSGEELAFVRENHPGIRPDARDRICRLVQERLQNGCRLRPGLPEFQVIPGPPAMVRVNWGWSDFGLLTSCRVAYDRAKHLTDPSEAAPHTSCECAPEDHQRGGGGFMVIPPAGVGRLFVSVWPVVDLGWTTVTGPALHVGPVSLAKAERREQ